MGRKKIFTNPLNSWKNQNVGFKVIRFWLGATWIYGGWNKASDSGFLNKGSSHYIGAQINGMLGSSPLSFFLRHLIEHASAAGWLIMLGEFSVGIATMLGIASELAALAGFFTSILLWLSVSWSVHPYYLGSDTAYAILWLAYFVYLRSEARKVAARKSITTVVTDNLSRRGLIQIGVGGVIAIIATWFGSKFQTKIATPNKATPIATTSELAVGGAKAFLAADGTPAILFRTAAGYFAYSRICTHQGCTVNFDQSTGDLLCPCHGAQYDPNHGAKVIAGPTSTPLASIKVVVSGTNILQA